MTLMQLSGATTLAVGYISDIETGKRTPPLDTLQLLAAALGTSVVDLLRGVPPYDVA